MEELRDRVERVVRQVVRELLAAGQDLPELSGSRGRRRLVVANWKMNLLRASARQWVEAFPESSDRHCQVVICPPAVLLWPLAEALDAAGRDIALGAQDLHPEAGGAHTGEVAAAMLLEAGARYVIVGHSERRAAGEDDELVARKLAAALAAGLCPILCLGETAPERERGLTLMRLRGQLDLALAGLGHPAPDPAGLVLAYEPVWAIGSGRAAGADDAQQAAAFLRERLAELFSFAWARQVRILYGGSVSGENAEHIAAGPDIDGFLVGGASLRPESFAAIVQASRRQAAGKEVSR